MTRAKKPVNSHSVTLTRKHQYIVSAVMTLALFGSTQASAYAESSTDLFNSFTPLTDDSLNSLRGGFITQDGLEINIGIEKMVFINDTLQSKLAMDLSKINEAISTSDMQNHIQHIQLGEGNTISPELQALIASGALNVIQNSLDGQKISHITELDIDVKNFKNMVPDLGRSIDFETARSLSSIR